MRLPWMLLLSVVGGGLVSSAWGVASGVHGLSSLPPVADPGPCTPPTNSSAPVGLQGYRRYFANASIIGRPVPCTRDDKICFRHNLIFEAAHDRCEPIGGGLYGACDLRPNRTEFERGGRIIGVCQTYTDPCPGYRMAYDGRCYQKEVVRDTICGCGVQPTRNFLDGVECGISPAKPINTQQPQEEGRCLIPDLRFPDIKRLQFHIGISSPNLPRNRSRKYRSQFKCHPAQALCFTKNEIRVKGFKGCHPPLKQGPCHEEHIVALDIDSAKKGRMEGTCVHVRGGCPRGYKRMLFDGQCHGDRDLAIVAPGHIYMNVYGENIVFRYDYHEYFSLSSENDKCNNNAILMPSGAPGGGSAIGVPNPPCGADNKGLCGLYEVHAEPPLPEL